MKWLVKMGEETLRVELPAQITAGQPFPATVNGKSMQARWDAEVSCLRVDVSGALTAKENWCVLEKTITAAIDGAPTKVQAEVRMPGSGQFFLRASVSPDVPGQEKRARADKARGTVVRSPLTGRVLSVTVQSGASVSAGESLVVIEAMKMENKIFAPAAGVVDQILVVVGQMVATGDLLCHIT